MIHAVLGSVTQDMVDRPATVCRGAVFADVLDAPVAELAMGDNVDAGQDFVDAGALYPTVRYVINQCRLRHAGTYLVLFETVLKDVLHNKTSGLPQSNFVPHAAQGLVDVLHDLRRRVAPAQLEELLPNMACITMDDGFRNAAEQFMHHDGLVFFRDRIERLLNDVATESVHAEVESVAADGVCNRDDLLGRAVLEASLNEKVAEAVDHQWIGLSNDGLDNLELLLSGADLELLLQKYRGLLVVVANDLVDNVFPVAAHVTIEKLAIVDWLDRSNVSRARLDTGLHAC